MQISDAFMSGDIGLRRKKIKKVKNLNKLKTYKPRNILKPRFFQPTGICS